MGRGGGGKGGGKGKGGQNHRQGVPHRKQGEHHTMGRQQSPDMDLPDEKWMHQGVSHSMGFTPQGSNAEMDCDRQPQIRFGDFEDSNAIFSDDIQFGDFEEPSFSNTPVGDGAAAALLSQLKRSVGEASDAPNFSSFAYSDSFRPQADHLASSQARPPNVFPPPPPFAPDIPEGWNGPPRGGPQPEPPDRGFMHGFPLPTPPDHQQVPLPNWDSSQHKGFGRKSEVVPPPPKAEPPHHVGKGPAPQGKGSSHFQGKGPNLEKGSGPPMQHNVEEYVQDRIPGPGPGLGPGAWAFDDRNLGFEADSIWADSFEDESRPFPPAMQMPPCRPMNPPFMKQHPQQQQHQHPQQQQPKHAPPRFKPQIQQFQPQEHSQSQHFQPPMTEFHEFQQKDMREQTPDEAEDVWPPIFSAQQHQQQQHGKRSTLSKSNSAQSVSSQLRGSPRETLGHVPPASGVPYYQPPMRTTGQAPGTTSPQPGQQQRGPSAQRLRVASGMVAYAPRSATSFPRRLSS
eukprot:gnl/MRDRNA2_/MRDRNA2_76296_c0_seq3.p1 gnl/MRDRNA2_/MRDRNA2_76296_c0~~gnl/MRDRNA2_/MRDRNA2_76296_c0_seq3.p1  ORF type:complete len:510 (-),score=115.23 gnl/MRDRNA2_/MRDRNA2_76296_c0_seq3:64-1593(-)